MQTAEAWYTRYRALLTLLPHDNGFATIAFTLKSTLPMAMCQSPLSLVSGEDGIAPRGHLPIAPPLWPLHVALLPLDLLLALLALGAAVWFHRTLLPFSVLPVPKMINLPTPTPTCRSSIPSPSLMTVKVSRAR